MLEDRNPVLATFLDHMNIHFPTSREHYLQRCWPVIERILTSRQTITVIDAGCGHAHESILFAALGAEAIGIDLREDGFNVALQNVDKFKTVFPKLKVRLINRDLFAAMAGLKADVIWVRQAISHIHPAERFVSVAAQCLKQDGLLVINDSNGRNPLVFTETLVEHWTAAKTLSWYVTDKYKDPVTKQPVPYAVERLLTSAALKRMLRDSGFRDIAVDFTGYVPVSIASKLPRITHGLEASLKKLPLLSTIGMEYTVVGRKL